MSLTVVRRPKVVLLGMITKMPFAGAVWGTLQYLLGLERLGYEVYYVEAHAVTPTKLMRHPDDDSSVKAAEFIAGVMARFDLGDHWAFHALHDDGRCYGMSATQLGALYDSAALLINYHGGTFPLPEHSATGRLVLVETDPVALQIEIHQGRRSTIDFLAAHAALFTWGDYDSPGCRLPISERFRFRRTRPPILVDRWAPSRREAFAAFTTVGNWRQLGHEITYEGEVYHWSKHYEFLKFLDLPRRTPQPFELALSSSSHDEADRRLLEEHGWSVRDALAFSSDLDAYREYVAGSRGEFTVAKAQNVRLRSGWFSERSASYLAAGRPVITQETGFSATLPTGEGLFAFSTLDDVLAAVESVNADYERHRLAAGAIARECFAHDVVLPRMLAEVGL